ncbi:MAG: hypothetical protein WAU24_01495 [Chitinophagaceae bacterium]
MDGNTEEENTANANILQPEISPLEMNLPEGPANIDAQQGMTATHKKWKDYFLQFLMIFLGVTLGFFSSNIRDKIINDGKEEHYISNLIHDLKLDTLNAASIQNDQLKLLAEMDSALKITPEEIKNIPQQDSFFRHFLVFYINAFNFRQNDNTLIQLRNAGGYSLIRKPGVLDSIIALENFYEEVKKNDQFYYDNFIKVQDFSNRLMKMPFVGTSANGTSVYPDLSVPVEVFTQYDKVLIEQLYNLIRNEQTQLVYYKYLIDIYKTRATGLMTFLQAKYDVE